ncbi:MAG: hypothetical protein ACR2N5_06435 [Solirubrobacterales bacterium]
MNEGQEQPALEDRVCPSCGAAANYGSWCDSCGFELTSVSELPTRAEYEGPGDPVPAPETAAPAAQTRLPLIIVASLVMMGIAVAVAALSGSG